MDVRSLTFDSLSARLNFENLFHIICVFFYQSVISGLNPIWIPYHIILQSKLEDNLIRINLKSLCKGHLTCFLKNLHFLSNSEKFWDIISHIETNEKSILIRLKSSESVKEIFKLNTFESPLDGLPGWEDNIIRENRPPLWVNIKLKYNDKIYLYL
jgi:hypothetical protein